MTGRQMRETERNIRSEEYLITNAADFAGINEATQMIAELTLRVGKIQQTYQTQLQKGGDVRYDYDIVKDTYDRLRGDMQEIRDDARAMERKIPGIADLFQIPAGSGRRKLIAAARVFAANAEQYKQKFLDRGADKNFITDLIADADALENALNEAAASTGERVGATDELSADVQAASDIVEDITSIVRRVYRNNPAKLAAWEYASRVERHTPKPRTPTPPSG